ncbi:hypothetical protein [Aeromicrobium sp. 179-A 4D2 NHS]|uniref:hypothetical protein n=1 Tax=Aeromicrobium sp. 179-A 4D2 NHS TaxID=3142375 RepID=UPI0039A0A153
MFRLTRAKDMDDNPATFASRANTFAANISEREHATLLVKKTDRGLEDYLIAPRSDEKIALDLGAAIGAKHDVVDFPELDTASVGHLVLNRRGATARETTAGIDPSELSRSLVTVLDDPGSWVAITFRRTTNTEKNRHRAWLSHRLGMNNPTHHTQGLTPLVIKVTAGSDSALGTKILLEKLAVALPGFDLDTKPKTPTRATEAGPLGAVVGVALAATIASFFVPALAPFTYLFAAVATFAAPWFIARWRGWKVGRGHWLELANANDFTWFETPGKWHGVRYKKPHGEYTKNGKTINAEDGDYPFAKNTFCVGPTVIVGLVAPQAGVASGERIVSHEQVPPVFLDRVGPYIGETSSGRVHLSAASTLYGTAVVGSPGSGKSRLIHGLFAWSMLDKRKPSGLPGFPGVSNTLIAFESKGGGVPSYRKWADRVGEDILVIDLNRHDSYAIDMLDVPGSFNERANFFVNAMIYAFGKDSIQDRSFRILVTAVAGGLCVTPDVASNMASENLRTDGGALYYANVILGSKGYKAAIELCSAVIASANEMERQLGPIRDALNAGQYTDPAGRAAAENYVVYATQYIESATALRDISERTESQFRSYVEAAANKSFQLLESAGGSWFSDARPKMSWRDILVSHQTVIVNTGASENGDAVPERLSQQISSMLLFTLKEAIARHCVEWDAQGKSVSIFSDELSLLAGHSSEVLRWVRDQGRSFGVRPFFATQRPEQLPSDVRSVFLNFVNLISFVQDERYTSEEIAAAIETDGDWTRDMIQHLPPYTAAIRAQFDKKRQQAYSARIADFEGNIDSFVTDQGYVPDPTPALVPTVPVAPMRPATPAPFTPVNDDGYPELDVPL